MKNNQSKTNRQGQNQWVFLLLALFLVGLIYGGFTISSLKKQTENLEGKITALNDQVNMIEEKNGLLGEKNIALEKDLKSLESKLAYYRSQVNQPQILGVKTEAEKKETIQPVLTVATPAKTASVIVDGLGSFKVKIASNETAFSLLQKAAKQNSFELKYDNYSFGAFVTGIGSVAIKDNQYWAFYYNGKYSNTGASAQKISKDDTTFWRLESF